ncbi:MAG: hypothetical protein QGG40_15185 [Myxococcota bacterium]|jgi:hypothetical protein|nr:hypothetical protein [Myxococcota bacterium]
MVPTPPQTGDEREAREPSSVVSVPDGSGESASPVVVEPRGPLAWLVRSVEGVLLRGVEAALALVGAIIQSLLAGMTGGLISPPSQDKGYEQTGSRSSEPQTPEIEDTSEAAEEHRKQ